MTLVYIRGSLAHGVSDSGKREIVNCTQAGKSGIIRLTLLEISGGRLNKVDKTLG